MNKIKLKNLVVVTSNKNKLAEINAILETNHKVSTIDIPEIQSLDLDRVVSYKAKAAYSIIKKPVLVDDVSLDVKSLKGLPGTFVKFFIETLGAEGTVKLIKNKSRLAIPTAAVAIYDGKKLKIFKGRDKGALITKSKGANGFGFDKVFIPKGHTKTYAELTLKEKNNISHRAKALKKVKKYLLDNNNQF